MAAVLLSRTLLLQVGLVNARKALDNDGTTTKMTRLKSSMFLTRKTEFDQSVSRKLS